MCVCVGGRRRNVLCKGNLSYVLGCFLFDNPLQVTDAMRFISLHALPIIISEGCLHGILTVVMIN